MNHAAGYLYIYEDIYTSYLVKQWTFSKHQPNKLKFQEKNYIKGCRTKPHDQTTILKNFSQEKHETVKAEAAKGSERREKLCSHVVHHLISLLFLFCLRLTSDQVHLERGKTSSSEAIRQAHACFDL